MQAFQSNCLKIIVDTPWYVRNVTLHRDLDMPIIKDHSRKLAHSFYNRLSALEGAIDVPKPCLDKREVTIVVWEALIQPPIEQCLRTNIAKCDNPSVLGSETTRCDQYWSMFGGRSLRSMLEEES
uniref:Uncharacterized protein n=1 Tax=Timema genevievae TaxID=629358 RepID=A0A7R9PMP1_TIMGE|nr:unnamed protein product [Timema genevievae]